MTETEWLTATDPKPMLEHMRWSVSNRKLRLFGCGLCRREKQLSEVAAFAEVIEAAERFSDSAISSHEWARVRRNNARVRIPNFMTHHFVSRSISLDWALQLMALVTRLPYLRSRAETQLDPLHDAQLIRQVWQSEWSRHTSLVCDIFGNPFRSIAIEPMWLTSDVRLLAEGIYQERAFDQMPILADALQEAGCDNDDILNHCRQPGEHVRGCWVIDLLTGRQ